MTLTELDNSITYWNTWASEASVQQFDIALFKIWIQFENFLADLFIEYATGQASEKGYKPKLDIQFRDAEQLNAFLRADGKKYVEYIDKIEKLSKHIFVNNPFDIVFLDAVNKPAFDQIRALRNYIAHESGEARRKVINTCFSGNESKFEEPNVYLLKKEGESKKPYYTYYVELIKAMAILLVTDPNV